MGEPISAYGCGSTDERNPSTADHRPTGVDCRDGHRRRPHPAPRPLQRGAPSTVKADGRPQARTSSTPSPTTVSCPDPPDHRRPGQVQEPRARPPGLAAHQRRRLLVLRRAQGRCRAQPGGRRTRRRHRRGARGDVPGHGRASTRTGTRPCAMVAIILLSCCRSARPTPTACSGPDPGRGRVQRRGATPPSGRSGGAVAQPVKAGATASALATSMVVEVVVVVTGTDVRERRGGRCRRRGRRSRTGV